MCSAVAAGTAFASSWFAMRAGSDEDSPTIINEKKTPIESTIPVFWNVARMPDAAPRCSGGALFMMPVMFGAENMPVPMPLRSRSAPNTGKPKLVGSVISRPNAAAAMSIPPVVNQRAPYRSASHPHTGPAMRNPPVSGGM